MPLWHGPNVSRIRPTSALTGVSRRELRQWIRSNSLDAVIFNEQRHWDAVITARETGVLTGAYVDYYTQPSVPLFWLYDFLLLNTQRHASVFSEHPQTLFIQWGTDCGSFAPRPRASRPLTFFHSAGWLVYDRKGTRATIEAFRRVRGDVRLVLHVQDAFSEWPGEWRDMIRADPRIIVRAETVAKPGLYHLGDVYVYPARLDGIGLTVPEAMACGLATVVPDEGPWNEFVTPSTGALLPITRRLARHDGYYWPEVIPDPEALQSVLQRYADDPASALEAGRRARALAETVFDWHSNAKGLPEWLERAHRLSPAEDLFKQARQQDLETNPTALRRWIYATLLLGLAGARFLGLRR
jgi:glycosyltransferase involved in cell wall biosynthesis